MNSGEAWLLDTNILIRWVQPSDSDFGLVETVTRRLQQADAELCYTSQILGEFWNVLTRPLNRNGYGFSVAVADDKATGLESQLRLLPDSPLVHAEWRQLLKSCEVVGAKVHDTRIAASMLVHGVRKILTFNVRDFERFRGIEAVYPSRVVET